MEKNSFEYYVERYIDGTITANEWTVLRQLIQLPEHEAALNELMDGQIATSASLPDDFPVVTGRILASVEEKISNPSFVPEHQSPIVHRVHFLRRGWFRYAAAILIILGCAAYVWTINKSTKQTVTSENRQLDIAPRGDRAILTLADGSTIVLDSAANGNLANQGSVQIIKLANGQIVYSLQGLNNKEALWNTMATPKGGQYQVALPDGSKVWLNASSSITFPTVFAGNKRQVKVQGEIYFEIAKNRQKPFIVDIDGKSVVEVLGTSFNINSYADEKSIKTTLLEGSVKVTKLSSAVVGSSDQPPISGDDDERSVSVVLRPGQQAISGENIAVQSNVDLDQTLAWKNGLFNFNNADLPTVMRQLERWYDIKVKYEGAVPEFKFQGKMDRGLDLSEVLEALIKMGAKLRLEGKILIVRG